MGLVEALLRTWAAVVALQNFDKVKTTTGHQR